MNILNPLSLRFRRLSVSELSDLIGRSDIRTSDNRYVRDVRTRNFGHFGHSDTSNQNSGENPFRERTVPARVGADAVADLRRSAMNRLKSLNSHTALHSGSALCNGFAFFLKPTRIKS